MKIKGYVLLAAGIIVLVGAVYFVRFYCLLDYVLAEETEVWGQFGDFIGGVLNPLLSFISITLLLKSLSLQYQANSSLRADIENKEKIEILRSFESLFFSLISAQKNSFDSLRLNFPPGVDFSGVKAVLELENILARMRLGGSDLSEIVDFLDSVDENDQIFGLSRGFYIVVMTVNDRLCEDNGFSLEDRRRYYKVLVNLTDFALLRLVMLCIQFLDYESAKYLRSCKDFEEVIKGLGLKYELY